MFLSRKQLIVTKLNFEESVLSHVRTKRRKQMKMRARIQKKLETMKGDEDNEDNPFDFEMTSVNDETTPNLTIDNSTSPVIRKPSKRRKSPIIETKKRKRKCREKQLLLSPVIRRQCKRTAGETQSSDSGQINIDCSSSVTMDNSSDNLVISQCSSQPVSIANRINESPVSKDITTSQSKSDVEITESSSLTVVTSPLDTGQDDQQRTPTKENINLDQHDSVKKRKRLAKNGLASRLQKLVQREKSGRRIWEHEHCDNSDEGNSTSYIVCESWREYGKLIVKCQQNVYVVVSDENKLVRRGSRICLHPPCQTIKLESTSAIVYLSAMKISVQSLPSEEADNKKEEEWSVIHQPDSAIKYFFDSLFLL